ncbi:hypothetical protein SESBI_35621 [Sesbania bispinosa]|nr:hypothetical protein SESBI_35621 [Sesbania bispinosa]
MVARRNVDRADGHVGTGDETSRTTPEEDNPVLQRILQRIDQLQEQNQTLQQQSQTLQKQVTTLAKGRTDEEIPEGDTGEFHPFSMEIAETPFPSDFREPPLKDYDGTTDPQAHKSGKEQTQAFQQPARKKKGYDGRGRNFQPRANWDDRRRTDQVGGYRFDSLTPLNTSRARILKEVYQSDLIRLPPQAEGPKGPDLSKWRAIWEGTSRRRKIGETETRGGMKEAQDQKGAEKTNIKKPKTKRRSEEWLQPLQVGSVEVERLARQEGGMQGK